MGIYGSGKKDKDGDKDKQPEPSPAERSRDREEVRLCVRRFEEARAAGVPFEDAECFARSTIDIGELRRLVKGGCDPLLIGRILL